MKITKNKAILALVLVAFGSVIPASAARRTTTGNPPPATGTVDKPVFSPL